MLKDKAVSCRDRNFPPQASLSTPDMTKYGLHGHLLAKAGSVDQLLQILLQAADLVADSAGCHLYVVSKDPQAANQVWITEIWDSKEAHDESLQNPAVRTLISQAMPLLDGPPSPGQTLEVYGGHGIS